jgi:DNA-binding transcriptional regulator YiaG
LTKPWARKSSVLKWYRAAAARIADSPTPIAYAAATSEGTAGSNIPDVRTIHELLRRTRMVYLVMDGEQVRSLREEKGMSRRDFAGEAGISVDTVRSVEREVPVTFRTGRAVASALGVEPSPSLGRVLTS